MHYEWGWWMINGAETYASTAMYDEKLWEWRQRASFKLPGAQAWIIASWLVGRDVFASTS
jgi:hypothetical protein